MIDILLPWPPSANDMWRGKPGGMYISKRYKAWREEACEALRWQQTEGLIRGPVDVAIHLSSPTKRAFDLDNRVKPILDLLVALHLIEDDDSTVVKKITVECGKGFTGAWIYVVPFVSTE